MQALAAASKTVDCLKIVHSLHAYFLLVGDFNSECSFWIASHREMAFDKNWMWSLIIYMAGVSTYILAVPILYEVDRVRDGKSFATRRVNAIQKGNIVFTLIASFQVVPYFPLFCMQSTSLETPSIVLYLISCNF